MLKFFYLKVLQIATLDIICNSYSKNILIYFLNFLISKK
jgi:hypothetical protein